MDICGDEAIFIPETECDECDAFLAELTALSDMVEQLQTALSSKQDRLQPGANIQLTGTTISAKDTTYTPGPGISIPSDTNEIRAERHAGNTYTKDEVDALINALTHASMEEVDSLPATGETNIIYLVPNAQGDGHDMFIWSEVSQQYMPIGHDTLDLTGYVKKTGDTMTGTLVVKNESYPDAYVRVYTNSEGGNVQAYHTDGESYVEMDDLNGSGRFVQRSGGNTYTAKLPADTGTIALTKQLSDGSVTKVGTATKGGVNQPIYLNAGVPTAGNPYVPKSGGSFTGDVRVECTAASSTQLSVGNTNNAGQIVLHRGTYNATVTTATAYTANRIIRFPDAAGSVQLTSVSSRRVKENIRPVADEEAKKLLDLDIVRFDYIAPYAVGKNLCGVIAEDVANIIPEAVVVQDGYDELKPINDSTNPAPAVDYRVFIPYLVKVVQILQNEIDILKKGGS